MTDHRKLEEALARATPWVRAEFGYVESVATGLGCERRLERGPGVAFRLAGRLIARAHPKREHLAVGFPDSMRNDVEAVTGALRGQKRNAWFNYSPEVGDRDTVELLLEVRVDAAAPSARSRPQPTSRAVGAMAVDDDADLRLALAVLRAFHEHERTTGRPSTVKPLRETLFFRWEGPRLPPGGKYSPSIPHSPAAREHRATHGISGLVYEHVMPIARVVRELLRNVPADEVALRQVLDDTADRVLITKSEDRALTAAGYRERSSDPADPWSRYGALGLRRADFGPYTGP